ncbi:GumC family protein [Emticicia sp.]|uniref:GumC family protein n=1 Tax=Emticicia sp. TaxID=1930953 RepID=UPI0037505C77
MILATAIYYFTRNEKKVYLSESTIYTGIASGYSLNGSNKADFYATSNAFDNLLSLIDSRETKQDVAIDLLAEHLFMKQHDPLLITWDAYDDLSKLIPAETKKILVKQTVAETRESILNFMGKSENNLIYKIISSTNPYYSVEALKNIKSSRISNSDLIKISYENSDPYICKRTLELLEQSFMQKHRLLREGQTESVVKYFETETKKAFAKLDSSEQIFLDFNKKNEIINYYEQTKAVAGEKEDLYALNHNLEMDKMSSLSSLDKVNENIKGRINQSLYGSDIIREREKLSDVYNKIALSEIVNPGTSNKKQVDSLKNITYKIEKNLKNSLDKLHLESNTPSGIPTKDILDEWLKTTLAFEQSKAKLTVMDKRKKEFEEEYRKFAPLGAMLKKIEREIGVSEQEYLELLHGLNLARLTQQNTELTSKLNIVDPPFLPLKPNASKRIIQVLIGFVVGFILVLAFVLANALINKTLLEPLRARKTINLPLLGIYPLLTENANFLENAKLRLLQQFLSTINTDEKPITVGILSTQKGEGKTTIINLLEQELTKLNYSVEKQLLLGNTNYKQLEISSPLILTNTNYGQLGISKPFNLEMQLQEQKNRTIDTGIKDFILIEFPSLDNIIIKPGLFPQLQYSILLCRANRVWSKIDKLMLSIFSRTTGNNPFFILNGVDTDFAEEYIGEVPKKRDLLRTSIKRVVKFEFGNRKKLR